VLREQQINFGFLLQYGDTTTKEHGFFGISLPLLLIWRDKAAILFTVSFGRLCSCVYRVSSMQRAGPIRLFRPHSAFLFWTTNTILSCS